MAESSEKPVRPSTDNDGNGKIQYRLEFKLYSSPRISKSLIEFQSKMHLPEIELVIVRVKEVGNNSTTTSADKKIPKQLAVCRFCFLKFTENDDNQNVLKTLCSCDMTLTHNKCAEDWFRKKGDFNCKQCSQDMKLIPVVILSSSTAKAENSLAPLQTATKERELLSGSSKATTRRGSIKEGGKCDSGSRRGWFGRWF